MNKKDLTNILFFAKSNNLMSHPFTETLRKWDESNREMLQQQEADDWLSSIEAHEL